MLADVSSVAVRALSFIAMFQAAGMAVFLALFGRELPQLALPLRRMGRVAAVLAAALVLIHLLLEAARMSGELSGVLDASLQGMVMQSSASIAAGLRLGGLVLLAIGFQQRLMPAGSVLGLMGAALVMLGFTAVGHTTLQSPRWIPAALLFIHLAVVAFWFGALLPLHLVNSREPPAVAGRIVERFSKVAIALVPGLLVAGALLAIELLPTLEALNSAYGRLLLLKVSGFAVLMGLAAVNKWRLGPALLAADPRAARAFSRSVLAEYVLIAAVLCVTAVLTTFYSPED
jgi:putative copper resistance protein D